MLIPGALCYALMKPSQLTEEELRKELETKYKTNISTSVAQREAMQKYFDGMKNGNAEQEGKMLEVMKQGNSKVKRHYAYDAPDAPDAPEADKS